MKGSPGCNGVRVALAINLELCHGAAARIEMSEGPDGEAAVLVLRGWIEGNAFGRLMLTLEELATRGIRHVMLDCSRLRHIDFSLVPRLCEALARVARDSGSLALRGLSPHLRELFRLAGFDPDRLRAGVPGDGPWVLALGAGREWTS